MKQEKLLKYENAKLKHQLIFTLPASKLVCGRICAGCYAIKSQVRFPKVVPQYRERMYQASLRSDFVSRIVAEIKANKKPLVAVRAHESGEFYSQTYIDSWKAIATQLPHITFYAFTKRLRDFNFTKLKSLSNFVILDSLQDGHINYNIIGKLDQNKFICPVTKHSSTAVCGKSCTYCMVKGKGDVQCPQFVKH